MLLSENKIKHCKGVAEYMYNNAEKYGLDKEEMYLLGLVHDIGYLFAREKHGMNGSELLKSMGYKYYQEVKYHGRWTDDYNSAALNLLRKADLSIDYLGRPINPLNRMDDVRKRYGEDSFQFKNVKKIVNNLY